MSALLAEAEVVHEVLVTERANHATDVVRDLELSHYAGLVILSGDGLLFEVSALYIYFFILLLSLLPGFFF